MSRRKITVKHVVPEPPVKSKSARSIFWLLHGQRGIGMTCHEIANILGMTPRTAQQALKTLCAKSNTYICSSEGRKRYYFIPETFVIYDGCKVVKYIIDDGCIIDDLDDVDDVKYLLLDLTR